VRAGSRVGPAEGRMISSPHRGAFERVDGKVAGSSKGGADTAAANHATPTDAIIFESRTGEGAVARTTTTSGRTGARSGRQDATLRGGGSQRVRCQLTTRNESKEKGQA